MSKVGKKIFGREKKQSGRSRNSPPVIELTGNELNVQEGETLRDAARRYYEYLRKNPANRKGFGTVYFTNATGRKKLESTSLSNPERFKLLPAVKAIIEKGDYLPPEKPNKPRSDGIVMFHHFEGNVKIGGVVRFIGVTVSEDSRGNKFYNLNEDPDILFK